MFAFAGRSHCKSQVWIFQLILQKYRKLARQKIMTDADQSSDTSSVVLIEDSNQHDHVSVSSGPDSVQFGGPASPPDVSDVLELEPTIGRNLLRESAPSYVGNVIKVARDLVLDGPLSMFYDIHDQDKNIESGLNKIFEMNLHRHQIHLSRNVGEALRVFVLGFVASLHLTSAFKSLLNIQTSYILPDVNQISLVTVRNIKNSLEFNAFIFQTNPYAAVQKFLTRQAEENLKGMLRTDNYISEYDGLKKVSIIETNRPSSVTYKFWNQYGQEVERKNGMRSPLKTKAYLTDLVVLPKLSSSTKFFRLDDNDDEKTFQPENNLKLGNTVLGQSSFEPNPAKNHLIEALDVVYNFMTDNGANLCFIVNKQTIFRFLGGLVAGVEQQFHLQGASRMNDEPETGVFDFTLLTHSKQGRFTIRNPAIVIVTAPRNRNAGVEIRLGSEFETESPFYLVVQLTFQRTGLDYKILPHPSWPVLLTPFLTRDNMHVHRVNGVLKEAIKLTQRLFGPNTMRQAVFGMALTKNLNPNLEQVYLVEYEKKETRQYVTSVVLKRGTGAHVINVADTEAEELNCNQLEFLSMRRRDFQEMGVDAIIIHNVEMKNNQQRNGGRRMPHPGKWKIMPSNWFTILYNLYHFYILAQFSNSLLCSSRRGHESADARQPVRWSLLLQPNHPRRQFGARVFSRRFCEIPRVAAYVAFHGQPADVPRFGPVSAEHHAETCSPDTGF